jgi:tetratricopeptide (TPR) repeat protein
MLPGWPDQAPQGTTGGDFFPVRVVRIFHRGLIAARDLSSLVGRSQLLCRQTWGSSGPMTDKKETTSELTTARETPSPSRSKRRIFLLGLGLIVLIFGTLYSWFARENKDQRGWDAYRAGRYDEAIDLFSEALQARPQDAQAYLGRSWAHLAKRQWQPALRDSTEALRLGPRSALALTAHANALEGLDQVPEAIKALGEAIDNDPHCASAYYQRARIAYSHNLKEANPPADVEKSIQLDPRFAAAYSLEALIRYENKDYARTIELCNKALELDPREATAYLYRGYALVAQGQFQKGESDIQLALRLDPSLEKVVNLLQPKGPRK